MRGGIGGRPGRDLSRQNNFHPAIVLFQVPDCCQLNMATADRLEAELGPEQVRLISSRALWSIKCIDRGLSLRIRLIVDTMKGSGFDINSTHRKLVHHL